MLLTIFYSTFLLVSLGMGTAVVLFAVSKAFSVYEDPLIAEVEDILPAANCGGCGSPGCKAFAEKLVNSEDISSLFCPVGGNKTMDLVAQKLGKEVAHQAPTVAVVLCQGSCEVRPKTTVYEGPRSCAISALVSSGETDCQYGCLGDADCVNVCNFNAMYMDPDTQMPVVVAENCTSCGACVEACPRDIMTLRPKSDTGKMIYVGCLNEDKGGIAKRACSVACIGCNKCEKVCPEGAITITNHLANIDPYTCTLCGECVPVCPTHSIILSRLPTLLELNVAKTSTND